MFLKQTYGSFLKVQLFAELVNAIADSKRYLCGGKQGQFHMVDVASKDVLESWEGRYFKDVTRVMNFDIQIQLNSISKTYRPLANLSMGVSLIS